MMELKRVIRERIDEDVERLEREGKIAERGRKHWDRWIEFEKNELLEVQVQYFDDHVQPDLGREIKAVQYGVDEDEGEK